MPAPATPIAIASDFPGLLTNVDPRDIPDGAAQEQTNITCLEIGVLSVRLGIREVTFSE